MPNSIYLSQSETVADTYPKCDRTALEIRETVIDDVRRLLGTQKAFDGITLVVLNQK